MSFFNTTLTNGIQDVSAILPLLGTQQIERHIVSALTGGYLYAAASPISLFGSLGAAKIAFTVAIACTVIHRSPDRSWIGAKWLADAGLSTTGDIAYHIGSPEARLQMTSVIDKSYIDNVDKLRIRFKPGFIRWNIYLISLSLIFAAIGNTPYIYLLRHSKKSPDLIPLWVYPLIRTLGTALVVICPQFMIQLRLLQIVRSRVIFLSLRKLYDTAEKGEDDGATDQQELEREIFDELQDIFEGETAEDWVYRLSAKLLQSESRPPHTDDAIRDLRNALDDQEKRHGMSPYTTTFLFILGILILIGSISTIIGYVGSFTVVQSANNSVGPLIWLGTEGGLSLLRILIWGSNPTFDDHEGLEFILDVPPDISLITCTNNEDDIKPDQQLPLKRSDIFLREIDPYLRPVEPFAYDGVFVYYTLAASAPFETSTLILYVTIQSYKDQASNVIVKMPDLNIRKWKYFKSPAVGDKQYVQVGAQIRAKENAFTQNPTFLKQLRDHCQAISDQLKRSHSRFNRILSPSDLESQLQGTYVNLVSDNYNPSTNWSLVLKKSKTEENATDLRVLIHSEVIYFKHKPSEKDAQSLYQQCGWWNEAHMTLMRDELPEERPKADKSLLGDKLERDEIDHLLVYESLSIESALAQQVASREKFLLNERQTTINTILDGMEAGSAHEKEILRRTLKAQSILESHNRLKVERDASYSRLSQYFESAVDQIPDGSRFAYDAGTSPIEHWRTANERIWKAAVEGSPDEYTSELESRFEEILADLRPRETDALHLDPMSPEAKRNYANLAMAKVRCLARHRAMHDRRKIERERSEGLKTLKEQIFFTKYSTEEEARERIKTVVRIMRSKYTKYLEITEDLIKQAGSLDMLLSIIEYNEVVTAIDSDAALISKPEEPEKISNVADRMLNMMCCHGRTMNPHHGVGSNLPIVSYNMVGAGDHIRPGNPFLTFWKPGVSCCIIQFKASSGPPGESREKVLLLSHAVSRSDTQRGKIWIVLESPDEAGAYGVREPIFRRLYSKDITSRGFGKQYVEMDVVNGQSYRLTIQLHEGCRKGDQYFFDSPELVDAEDGYQWCEENPMLLEDKDVDEEEGEEEAETEEEAQSEGEAESESEAKSEEEDESEAKSEEEDESEEEGENEGEAESEEEAEQLKENEGMDKEQDEAEAKDVGKKEDAGKEVDEGKVGTGNSEGMIFLHDHWVPSLNRGRKEGSKGGPSSGRHLHTPEQSTVLATIVCKALARTPRRAKDDAMTYAMRTVQNRSSTLHLVLYLLCFLSPRK